MGSAAGPNVVEDGLVLALDASSPKNYNVGVSTNWTDRVGGNNGTLDGGTYHSDGPFVGAGYVEFDGNTDKLSCTPSNLTGQFTIEGWWYATAFTSASVFFGKWGYECLLRKNGSNIEWYSAGNLSGVTATYTFNTGQWYHLAVSRDSSNVHRVFINGVQVLSTTDSDSITMTDFCIGAQSTGSTTDDIWTGYISNFRIVNGTALYTSNFTVPTKSLTAVPNTTLLTCQGNTIADASSSALSITTGGDISLTKEPFTGAGAVEFDGTSDYLDIASSTDFAFGTGDFTIEVWVYLKANSVGVIYSNEVANSLFLYLNSGNLVVRNYGTTNLFDLTGPSLKTWTHIALSRSGTDLRLFFNGVQQGSTVTNSTNWTQNGTEIGAYNNGTQSLNGYMSNLRVVKGTALYTSNFTAPTRKLDPIENTTLLTCQGQNIKDYSSSAHTITVNGNAKATIVSSAFDFDGTNDRISGISLPSISKVTVEWWGTSDYPDTNYAASVMSTTSSAWTDGFGFYQKDGNVIWFVNHFNDNKVQSAATSFGFTHWVGTYDLSNIKLYRNGSLVGTTAYTTAINQSTTNLDIASQSTSYHWDGKISNVKVYNKALTLAEVAQNYNALKGRYGY